MNSVIEKIKILRLKEKEIFVEILELLQIINDQRLYVTCNTNSMFKFCVRVLGYSEMEASIRVNALKISQKLPEIKTEIEAGAINLTQASMLGAFSAKNPNIDVREIKNLVKNKTLQETKFILDKVQNPDTKQDIKITLPEHIANKLKAYAESESLDLVEAIEFLIDNKNKKEATELPVQTTSINQRYIAKKAREFVISRAQHQCEARYNNKRCTSKTNLNIDHIKPIGIGGKSEISNLRVLCFHCNQRAHITNNEAAFLYRKVNPKESSPDRYQI